jgi:hypothetical protein
MKLRVTKSHFVRLIFVGTSNVAFNPTTGRAVLIP